VLGISPLAAARVGASPPVFCSRMFSGHVWRLCRSAPAWPSGPGSAPRSAPQARRRSGDSGPDHRAGGAGGDMLSSAFGVGMQPVHLAGRVVPCPLGPRRPWGIGLPLCPPADLLSFSAAPSGNQRAPGADPGSRRRRRGRRCGPPGPGQGARPPGCAGWARRPAVGAWPAPHPASPRPRLRSCGVRRLATGDGRFGSPVLLLTDAGLIFTAVKMSERFRPRGLRLP
jgi:hypothetical protein